MNLREPMTQKDQNGCGVACIAFLLDKSYQDTKKLFDSEKIASYGSDCPEMAAALNANNQKYSWKKYTGGTIPNLSIVYLGPSDYYKTGHYLVKYNNFWMNPWVWGRKIETAKSGFIKRPRGEVKYIIYPVNKEEICPQK